MHVMRRKSLPKSENSDEREREKGNHWFCVFSGPPKAICMVCMWDNVMIIRAIKLSNISNLFLRMQHCDEFACICELGRIFEPLTNESERFERSEMDSDRKLAALGKIAFSFTRHAEKKKLPILVRNDSGAQVTALRSKQKL